MPRTTISADVNPEPQAAERRSQRAETAGVRSGPARGSAKALTKGLLATDGRAPAGERTGTAKAAKQAKHAEVANGAGEPRTTEPPAPARPTTRRRGQNASAAKALAAKAAPSTTRASKASPVKASPVKAAAKEAVAKAVARKDAVAKAPAGKEAVAKAAGKEAAAGAGKARAPKPAGGAAGERRAAGRVAADVVGAGAATPEHQGAAGPAGGGHPAGEAGGGRHAAAKGTVERPASERAVAGRSRAGERPASAGGRSSLGYASDAEFLARQRGLLLAERATYAEQAESLRAEAESLVEEMEPGDTQFDDESGEGGTVTVDRERDLALSAQATAAVQEIDDALAKIERGTYGLCESCGEVIPAARLEALPYARLCVACKSGGLSRR